jgi:hypothetical protein
MLHFVVSLWLGAFVAKGLSMKLGHEGIKKLRFHKANKN